MIKKKYWFFILQDDEIAYPSSTEKFHIIQAPLIPKSVCGLTPKAIISEMLLLVAQGPLTNTKSLSQKELHCVFPGSVCPLASES